MSAAPSPLLRNSALLLALAAGFTAASPSPREEAVLGMERAAMELARKGRSAEARDLLAVLRAIGEPEPKVAKLEAACRRAMGKASKPAPEAARLLAKAAARLGEALSAAEGEARLALARAATALDSGVEAAQAALGRVRHEGRFVTPEVPAALRRRAAILEATARARRLEVPVVRSAGTVGMLKTLYGSDGVRVAASGVEIQSCVVPVEVLERVLRDVVRALALSRFVCGGPLEALPLHTPLVHVWVKSREEYMRAWKEACQNGGLVGPRQDWAKELSSYADERGHCLRESRIEADVGSYLFWYAYLWSTDQEFRADGQPCLDVGHISWMCHTFFGCAPPNIVALGVEKSAAESATFTPDEIAERQRMFRIAHAGVFGARSWLRWLARRRDDPPWTATMLDRAEKIGGKEMLKAMVVVEYLQETERFRDLWMRTSSPDGGELPSRPIPGIFEEAIAEPVPRFEERWRAWLAEDEPGLVQRLAASEAPRDPVARRAFEHLRLRRSEAAKPLNIEFPDPALDEALSRGCRAHARYLALNPKQAEAWPDAHEEWSDRAGFSPEGSWGGLHSVIAPGVEGPEEAIDGWLATFYHRLPLLHETLLGFGWGFEQGCAVLDASSLAAPAEHVLAVCWPPDGARDVPLRFRPELPNPVPGEDQSRWGYPVTLQAFYRPGDVTMRLFAGGATEVPCHSSSPAKPTNPDLVPPDAYCLIPKAPLEPRSTYTAVASGFADGSVVRWSFTTGAR